MEAREREFLDALDEYRRAGTVGGMATARTKAFRLYREALEDVRRLDWMQEHFVGADFDYGDAPNETVCVLLIEVSPTAKVGADLRTTIDSSLPDAATAPHTGEDGK